MVTGVYWASICSHHSRTAYPLLADMDDYAPTLNLLNSFLSSVTCVLLYFNINIILCINVDYDNICVYYSINTSKYSGA